MKIIKIWLDNDRIYGLTDDGRTLWQSLLYYRRLRNASEEEAADYEMDDEGIHWPKIDEDISFESFEYDDPEPTGISLVFLSRHRRFIHPACVMKGIRANLARNGA